jgi:hypothetical protein
MKISENYTAAFQGCKVSLFLRLFSETLPPVSRTDIR